MTGEQPGGGADTAGTGRLTLTVAVVALVISAVALTLALATFSRPTPNAGTAVSPAGGQTPTPLANGSMMGGTGGMMGGTGGGMMGGTGGGMMGGTGGGMMTTLPAGPQPGQSGFQPGTAASPRVILIWAGPGYEFTPASVTVVQGETVTFVVTTVGPLTHEFMVGPAADVAADVEGTPEVADIGMMQSKSITYTFSGNGPFAFACHAPGHYENGMRGVITVIG